MIRCLAKAGWRLLLRIHDFAEDNRPVNYQHLIAASGATDKADIDRYLYPVASQIHYATLTRADASAIEAIGKIAKAMQLPSDARWCLYPVRGIRRKSVDSEFEADVQRHSGQLVDQLQRPTDSKTIEANAAVIREHYSIDKVGRSLLTIYKQLASASIDNETQPPLRAGVGVDTISIN